MEITLQANWFDRLDNGGALAGIVQSVCCFLMTLDGILEATITQMTVSSTTVVMSLQNDWAIIQGTITGDDLPNSTANCPYFRVLISFFSLENSLWFNQLRFFVFFWMFTSNCQCAYNTLPADFWWSMSPTVILSFEQFALNRIATIWAFSLGDWDILGSFEVNTEGTSRIQKDLRLFHSKHLTTWFVFAATSIARTLRNVKVSLNEPKNLYKWNFHLEIICDL